MAKRIVIIENGEPYRQIYITRDPLRASVEIVITTIKRNKIKNKGFILLTVEDADELGKLLLKNYGTQS